MAAASTLAGGPPPDVLVVGLGASGLEAIVALAERGADVVGVDAVGVAAGAAGANGGFLLAGLARFHHDAVAAYGRDVAVRWYRRSQDELARIMEEESTARPVGSLRLAADAAEEADVRAQAAALRRDGITVETYDGPLGTGIVVPGDGVVDPVARCRRLAHRALAAGARLVAPARVVGFDDGAVVLESVGRVPTPRVLVAVDGGLERLVPALAPRVRTARLQMLATAPDPGVDIPLPVYHRGGLDYVQQLPDGRILLGGGRDVGGDAEWGAPATPSAPVQAHLDAWLAVLGASAPVTHRWSAHAAFTGDRLPIDERRAPGVHVVGAHSGHGNVLGGLLARGAALDLLRDASD